MSVNENKTYPEMNEIIKDMLADNPGPFVIALHSYVTKRIEELEKKVLEQDRVLYKIYGLLVEQNKLVFKISNEEEE
jgi:hypothetical protein